MTLMNLSNIWIFKKPIGANNYLIIQLPFNFQIVLDCICNQNICVPQLRYTNKG
jgi:hypothetical protein